MSAAAQSASSGPQVTVRVPTILRAYTGGASTVTVSAETGSTVIDLITRLESKYPGIRARVLDEAGQIRRFVNVYVDDEDVRFGDGLQTTVAPGTTLSIIPAVAGG